MHAHRFQIRGQLRQRWQPADPVRDFRRKPRFRRAASCRVPHYHESREERVYGLEGTVTYTIAGEQCDIKPGGTAFVPRGVVHGFSNRSGAVAKCLCVLTPGVLGPEYFEELAAEIATGKPNPTVMAGIMKRYGLIPATA
jgi:mannose-6-phosphate isomerase-like protein (cupin superfamily)